MDPNVSKLELLDRFKEDDSDLQEISRIEESDLLQSPRFKRLHSSSPPRSGSSSPVKSSANANNSTSSPFEVIPKLQYRKSNPHLKTPTKPKQPLQLSSRPQQPRFLPMSPTKKKLPEMKVSLTPAQRMEKKPGRLLNTNDILSQYDFKETVGSGAFANVYRAINKHTGMEVAVKEIIIEDDDNVLELMSEIDLLKILKHKNIVKYHGFLRNDKKLFIFLEYCSGGSLRSLYKKNGPLSEEQVIRYMSQVLEGLIYLHEQGVVHRDVKAANILLTNKGDIKLTDFGVSTKETNKTIKTYSIAGTPNWMAPEVISSDGTSTASDIWSLGATVVELLAGEPLYAHLNEMAALHAIVIDEYPPIPQFITAPCRDFLLRCFEKQPKNRITAKELIKHEWLNSKPVKSHIPLDSIKIQKKKNSKSVFLENDFNSIKRHNTKKFLPMEVTTFKHSEVELDDFIDNVLVDELHGLNLKKSTESMDNHFEPMTYKDTQVSWDDLRDQLLQDPYNDAVTAEIIKFFESDPDEVTQCCDPTFLSQLIQWVDSLNASQTSPLKLLELLYVILVNSEELLSAFIDLGGLPLITSWAVAETSFEVKKISIQLLTMTFEAHPESFILFVRSGCFRKSLVLLQAECKEEPEVVKFVIHVIYKAFKERVVSRELVQLMTLNYPNFLDWVAVLLLHFVNNQDLPSVDKAVSIICYSRGSPLLTPNPILLNSMFKVFDKLFKKQQLRLLKFIKSFNVSELPEYTTLLKFVVKITKRVSVTRQLDNDILNLACSILLKICHLNQEAQCELVKLDCLGTFQRLMNSTLPCTEYIIPLLCGFSFNDRLTAKLIKDENGILEDYLELLIDPVWQANAMDSLVALHDRVGGDKIPRLLLTNGCQFLIKGISVENSLNYELFLSRLVKLLGLYGKSISINQIRLALFTSDDVIKAIFQRITKYKSDLVIQVNLFKLLKALSMNNFEYDNYAKIVNFVKSVEKTNVLMIDQLINEILTAENNKENAMMKPPAPPVFNIPNVLSHSVAF